MFCKYCGEKIDDDAKFCPKCGARLARQESNHCLVAVDKVAVDKVAVDKVARGAAETNEATTETEAVSLAGETAETASMETAASEAETSAEIAETTGATETADATEIAEETDAVPVQGDAASSEVGEDATATATDTSSIDGDSVNAETGAEENARPDDGAAAEAVKDEDSALTSGGADDTIGASGAAETSIATASDDKQWNISPKSGKTALLLAIFGGVLGLHRFYVGEFLDIFLMFIMWAIEIDMVASGEYLSYASFCILAILILWEIIDIILLTTGHYKDHNGRIVPLSIEKYLTARTLEDGSGVEIYAFDVPPQNRCGITALTIPSRIGGVPVVSIADGAFEDCTALRSVKIPRTVTRIGKGAFDGCSNLSLKSQAAIKAVQNASVAFKAPPANNGSTSTDTPITDQSGGISSKTAAKPLGKQSRTKAVAIAAAAVAVVGAAAFVFHSRRAASYSSAYQYSGVSSPLHLTMGKHYSVNGARGTVYIAEQLGDAIYGSTMAGTVGLAGYRAGFANAGRVMSDIASLPRSYEFLVSRALANGRTSRGAIRDGDSFLIMAEDDNVPGIAYLTVEVTNARNGDFIWTDGFILY